MASLLATLGAALPALFSVLETWKVTAQLLERFGEAYISWRVKKIRQENESVTRARNVIIDKINLARAQRNQTDLIELNRALYLVEYAGMQFKPDQTTQG